LCGYLSAERSRVDVVDESPLAVDLDHGQPFAVPRLELRISADVDLLEVEGDLRVHLVDDRPGALAEVTALRVIQADLACRYG
jgi:hypothetical protein